jgi:hypothetical protein
MMLRLTFLAAALLAAPARADEAPAPDPKEQASLQGFAVSNPACMEWSDGCAVCKREAAVHCSTPGIACQPSEIACKAP